jgi:hypothetical protein
MQVKDIAQKLGNRFFENVPLPQYLGLTVTNQNLIQEEIKGRLNLNNVCCHSVQNILSSRLKNAEREYTKLQFCLWLCMDGKHDF